jgi:hypothetical protein
MKNEREVTGDLEMQRTADEVTNLPGLGRMGIKWCRVRCDDDGGRFERREAKTRMYRKPKNIQTRSAGEYDANVDLNVVWVQKCDEEDAWWIG